MQKASKGQENTRVSKEPTEHKVACVNGTRMACLRLRLRRGLDLGDQHDPGESRQGTFGRGEMIRGWNLYIGLPSSAA